MSDRRNCRKLSLFYKIQSRNAPDYLIDCIDENINVPNYNYNLRNSSQYRNPRCRLETYSKSYFPSTIRLWNALDPELRAIQSFQCFKKCLSANTFHVPCYYLIGNRKNNIIHTRLRHRCSSLGADLFRVNLKNDPSCPCGWPLEDAIHYFIECPLYAESRNTLIGNIAHFTTFSIQNLLFGSDEISEDLNTRLFKHVHHFIQNTHRFD